MNFNYILSVSIGLFVGSLVLLISRLIGFPITGIILAVVLTSFIAAFLYHPSTKKDPKHRSLRGTSASVLFCLIFSIAFTFYYIPRLGSLYGRTDLSMGVALLLILLFTVIGGIILGTIGGSIGSTFRDLFSVFVSEKK